jgi:uncharacterized membrane protein (DUF485 family)
MVLDHGPSGPAEKEDPAAQSHNARLGLVLFSLYAAVYAAFVTAAAFWPDLMRSSPLWGVNLAVLSGFGLIAGAFLLALLYGALCRSNQSDAATPSEGEAK